MINLKINLPLRLCLFLFLIGLQNILLAQDISSSKVLNSLYFGSCNRTDLDPKIWDTITNQDPEVWVWLGDIVYSEKGSMKDLSEKYALQKQLPAYKKLEENTTILGVWDDHDFGENDAGASFSKKKESRKLLFDFLAIPKNHPAQEREGAYQSYCFGGGAQKVCLYLLDVRYFKEDYEKDSSPNQRYKKNKGLLLGTDQWSWLENELFANDATINLFAGGIQLLSAEHPYEKWANFPLAQKRFFDLLTKYSIQTPIYLSGDRHIAEVSYQEINPNYWIYDITSSGLTHSYDSLENEPNQHRISPLLTMLNFAKIEINWETLELQAQIIDVDGIPQFIQKIAIQ
jgi:alkaline phosphatase D